jgi:hypothetical protein
MGSMLDRSFVGYDKEILSPYLFIICAEGLSSLIRDAQERHVISGTSICRGAPPVSHLLFADDCYLSFKANESQAQVMKNRGVALHMGGVAFATPKKILFLN